MFIASVRASRSPRDAGSEPAGEKRSRAGSHVDIARRLVLNAVRGFEGADGGGMTEVSIVIPMRNEAANIDALIARVESACAELSAYEMLVVDDGSSDGTSDKAAELMATRPALRLIRHRESAGQSAATHSGVLAATFPVICTLDGDGQNPPEELPKLFRPLLDDAAGGLGLVAGQRVGRRDKLSKILASRVANAVRGALLGDGVRDTGCGLKCFRRDAFLALPYFDHMHRYLPALFRRDGWEVALVDVAHEDRVAGRSNYSNLQRALVGLVDLVGVSWLILRRKKARPEEARR